MLPRAFLQEPVAHRALHDRAARRPENSRAAIRAAIGAGYAMEIDLQLSSDGQAMVFHDYDLGRLTEATGAVRQRDGAALARIVLRDGDEGIPTLAEVLALVAGRAPLLIELKDQDGGMGPDVGALERAVAEALRDYRGDVAVMSFNPHSVAEMARLLPDCPRGLTTCAFEAKDWPTLNESTRARLRTIPDFGRTGACFISHDRCDLDNPAVAALKARGVPVLCWTVRSAEQEAEARAVADNITFEGYAA